MIENSSRIYIERASDQGKGNFYPPEQAKISVFDVGLQRGYGVFEVMRTYQGQPFRLEDHIDRLFSSAKAIKLDLPWDKKTLVKKVHKVLCATEEKELSLKLMVTGGEERGRMEPADPNLVIFSKPLSPYPDSLYAEGAKVITTQKTPFLPAVKSLNYLHSFIARREAYDQSAHETLFLDQEGYVLEGTTSNIFVVRGNSTLLTPEEDILPGVTRKFVIEIASLLQLEVQQRKIPFSELFQAQELFLTSTVREIMPVVKVDGREIGSGLPGEITGGLLNKYRELAPEHCADPSGISQA